MEKIAAIVMIVLLCVGIVGCNSGKEDIDGNKINITEMNAKQIIDQFVSADFPINKIIEYDEKTDPNNLLGRPEQYTSKINFADSRVEQWDINENPIGGSIEVFNNTKDAKKRYDYVKSFYEASGLPNQYMYLHENVLFRIDYDLTPSEAEDYEKGFNSLVDGDLIEGYSGENNNTDGGKSDSNEFYFKDNILIAPDVSIKITDYKVINPGENGNAYGDKPVIAFWYTTTNLSGEETDPLSAWVMIFEAIQDNDPNVINTLSVATLPDDTFLESQTQIIKHGGTVSNAIAYELDDLSTPVKLKATNNGKKLGEQTFELSTETSTQKTNNSEAQNTQTEKIKEEQEPAQQPNPSATSPTTGQKNALKAAESYLNYTAFSYTGLIEQLEYEGYSTEEATFAATKCGADWNEQAAKKAASYIEYTSFSRSGLIEQLEYEGFTKEQAEYGATAVGY